MGERLEWMEKLLQENMEDSAFSVETNSNSEIDDETTTYFETTEEEESELEENAEDGTFYIFKEDNPYKVAERDEQNGVYQVIGNEIIMIARAEGVCCLCSEVNKILYIDNSYGGNIPAQICLSCINIVLTGKEDPA